MASSSVTLHPRIAAGRRDGDAHCLPDTPAHYALSVRVPGNDVAGLHSLLARTRGPPTEKPAVPLGVPRVVGPAYSALAVHSYEPPPEPLLPLTTSNSLSVQ